MSHDTEGGKWREVFQALVSRTFKAAISHTAVKTTLILFFPLYRTFALFVDGISRITSLLALLVVCLLSVISVYSCLLPVRGDYKCCSCCKKSEMDAWFCFCWRSVGNFPPPLPQRQEMSQCLHSVLTLPPCGFRLWMGFALSPVRGRKRAFL